MHSLITEPQRKSGDYLLTPFLFSFHDKLPVLKILSLSIAYEGNVVA